MAIQFLNNVDFNLNQAQEFVLENLSTDPASGQTDGRLIYNTSSNVVKVFNGTAWVEVGGGVTDLTVSSGTYISLTDASAATGSVNLGTVDISAVDGTASVGERYLTKNNTWAEVAAIPGTYDWDIAGDSGTETVASGDTITFAGGTNVTTSYNTTTNTLTINSTDQYIGTVTSVDLSMPSAFTVTNSPITSSGTLTVTGAGTVSQYIDGTGALQTFPTLDNYQYWTLSDGATSTNITSTGTATFQGTTNEVEVGESSGTITIGLPDDVTIAGELTVSGNGQSSFGGQVTIPTTPVASTDAASKAYVDSVVEGGLIYQGGYNASTNTPDLTTSPNSILKGWTYTVTADGTFFGEQLRVGDVLIAEQDDPSALADWTTVQNNIDLADASTVGIGNVAPGEAIDVSYSSGTATVSVEDSSPTNKGAVIVAGGNGIDVSYSSGTATVSTKAKRLDLNSTVTGVTRAEAGGITTFTIDVTDANVFGTGAAALDVMVEVIGNAANAGDTVYAETGRSVGDITIKFVGSVANGDYQVLLNYVG